ncbi:MAG: hypothetical protein HZA46_22600 [Planctomycetales bacterium]|nr:hypothetical protein [Planctomycetales bacterium]
MPQTLFQYCVYAIVQGERLAIAAARGKPVTFQEERAWVTGKVLLEDAQVENLVVPVLLGDATDCRRLAYWGLLTKVQVAEKSTHYTVDRVRELDEEHSPQELFLRSSSRKIAAGFIKSYAICVTPDFLPKCVA